MTTDIEFERVIADKSYDSDEFLNLIRNLGAEPVIIPREPLKKAGIRQTSVLQARIVGERTSKPPRPRFTVLAHVRVALQNLLTHKVGRNSASAFLLNRATTLLSAVTATLKLWLS